MANRDNQHFVPQFYFKLFTRGDRRIHVLEKKHDRIILNASIKGQCARHKFYGSEHTEGLLSALESRHSVALKRILALATPTATTRIEPQDLPTLWEAILFQRARTELEVEKEAPTQEAIFLHVFKEWLKRTPDVEHHYAVLEHVERGDVLITQDPHRIVLLSIRTALENVELISDLDLHILRNCTDYPFVFGDSPVVFYNTYYYNVTTRGVLGYQTPGLQIFYPLDSRTLAMLIDDQVYGGRYRDSLVVDIDDRCDVSQLNALQLHHCLNAAYFADAKDADYVSELWQAHKPCIVQPQSRFHTRNRWLVDGEPVDQVLQSFEPQLEFKLRLSLIECQPIHPAEYRFRRRSPELVEEHDKRAKHVRGNR